VAITGISAPPNHISKIANKGNFFWDRARMGLAYALNTLLKIAFLCSAHLAGLAAKNTKIFFAKACLF
jgi:hypothetical protein